jgi:predicted SprT family Zn-dependent metalloprotease
MFDRPTPQTYAELQQAYDHFNKALFGDQLPACLLTLQREKRTHGYFSSKRFVHRDGQTYTDEIALNPSFFAVVPPKEIMQTIVHEMAHAWQFHFGEPGRRGYHNKEWAEKMEAIGLMPSTTGQPGGAKTGERMNDYSIVGGSFESACDELLGTTKFAISWFDRFPPEPPSEGRVGTRVGTRTITAVSAELEEAIVKPTGENKSLRVKQRCPHCGNQAWCKPGMKLACAEDTCDLVLMKVADEEE